ncbi:MAG: HAD family hydrolase [Chloroflexi bacterium]|nr:HAD family hydrolase [Chloroflexota bacterium]MDA1296939.1 HAD family hydrolase [Chloroflexota bacterium]
MILNGPLDAAPQAVAFDCYRTLVSNDHDEWRVMFGRIIKEQSLPFTKEDLWDRWRKYELQFRAERTVLDDPAKNPPFMSYEQAWSGCFARVFEDAGVEGDAAAAGRRCVEHLARRPLFPDTVPALQALIGKVKVGVFSNADDRSLRPLLKSTGIRFDAIASSESARVYKPAPAAFNHILEMLGASPERTWYVGDHLYDDVEGGNRAGMTTVWINRTGAKVGPDDATPSIEITDLRELPQIIASIGK